MQAIKMNRHIDSEILHLVMPKDMIGKHAEIIVLVESNEIPKIKKSKRKPGSAKGMIQMSDDFEAPLDNEIIEEFYK